MYRTAIELTISVITARARRYRNLVIAVVATSAAAVLTALTTGSGWAALACVALVPLGGLFTLLDARQVSRWRLAVLSLWAQRGIDLQHFGNAVRSHPALPVATLSAMIDQLACDGMGPLEADVPSSIREAVVEVIGLADDLALRQHLLKVLATSAAVVLALLMPLLGAASFFGWCLLLIAALCAHFVLARTALRRMDVLMQTAAKGSAFASKSFWQIIERLPFNGRDRFMRRHASACTAKAARNDASHS